MKYSTSPTNKKEKKFYVVWIGRKTGIFNSWEECKAQVNGYPDAKYKSFESLETAQQASASNYEDYFRHQSSKSGVIRFGDEGNPVIPSYCVDASCSGNPGILEYRGVNTETGVAIFTEGRFQQGTNNVGEFLAIVRALSILQDQKITAPIYSDSRNAIAWVRKKKCKTRLIQDSSNAPLFVLIARAEVWLQKNSYENQVLKWDTMKWGENPADYKRK